jgi:glycosyltransferase involved in cell wall biosynthesis
MKIVWLCSWYPNPLNPFDGDFIQRHARAVAGYTSVSVFFVSQAGEATTIPESHHNKRTDAGVNEEIFLFRFRRTGVRLLDKLRYNMLYYGHYKSILRNYIRANGKPDLVHVHIPMKAGVMAQWILRRWNIPYIVSEQSSQYSKQAPGNFYTRSLIHRKSVKRIFRQAHVVTNVSGTVGNVLKDLFELKDVRVIHNTVNTDLFYYKPRSSTKFRFVHVSTLTEQKNADGILRATAVLARETRDFELVIVGPASDSLKKLAKDLSLDDIVYFKGEVVYREVAMHMQEASAMVLFSRHENFPCVIVEALCCGLPCIAAEVGGIAEAIEDSNGLLVKNESEDELVDAMRKMKAGHTRYDRAGIAKQSSEKYGYATIGKQFYELYREILAER